MLVWPRSLLLQCPRHAFSSDLLFEPDLLQSSLPTPRPARAAAQLIFCSGRSSDPRRRRRRPASKLLRDHGGIRMCNELASFPIIQHGSILSNPCHGSATRYDADLLRPKPTRCLPREPTTTVDGLMSPMRLHAFTQPLHPLPMACHVMHNGWLTLRLG